MKLGVTSGTKDTGLPRLPAHDDSGTSRLGVVMINGPDALRELIRRLDEEIDASQWHTDPDTRRHIWTGVRAARDEAMRYLDKLDPPKAKPLIRDWHEAPLEN